MRKVLFFCLCILILSRVAADDFGDFSGSYDYGGGGGWSSSGGGWSSGGGGGGWSGSGGGYSGGSRSGGGYSGGGGGDVLFLALAVVGTLAVFGIGYFFKYYLGDLFEGDLDPTPDRKRYSTPVRRIYNPQPPGAVRTSMYDVKPIISYSSVDPNFSVEAFKQRLSNIYVRLQNAWQAKDLEPVRPFLTDALYNQYDMQLSNYRHTKTTNVVEHIAVLGISITGWKQQGGEDVIIAVLRSRINDYVIDDATGQVVRGSRTAEKFMEYEYALSRKTGVKTASAKGVRTVNCPNCGSPIDINQSAVCKYCGSTLQAAPEDWVISGIKGLSQRTVGK